MYCVCGEHRAAVDHLRKMLLMDGEKFGHFLEVVVTRWPGHPGVGQHTTDVASTPFHHPPRPHTPIHTDSDVPGEENPELLNTFSLWSDHIACLVHLEVTVLREPLELFAGDLGQVGQGSKAVDEIGIGHLCLPAFR